MSERPSTATRRQPIARHGALRSPNPFVQILTILGAMVAVVVVSLGAIGAYTVWDGAQALSDGGVSIGDDEAQLPPSIGEIEGGVNLLLVGTDSCEGANTALSGACQNGDTEGERNDVTMLVHISDEPRRVTVVSFPRDMLVPIPSCPDGEGGQYSAMSAQMLNVSYMYGGLACSVLTIENLTGVDIQFAGAIRWTGVINMSDAIGGVDVCLAEPVSDAHTGLDLGAGTQSLVGVQALQFLRMRHGIGDGSDLGRISNQQQFMSSMVRKLQSDGILANPATLYTLATTAIKQVSSGQLLLSDTLSNPTRMVQIAMAVRNVPYEDIVFVQYPTSYAEGGSRVLPITDAADGLFAALAANQPIMLTGDASAGNSQTVVGDATQPVDPLATPTPGATDAPVDPAVPAQEAFALDSRITGQSAAQVTCTLAEQ